MQWDSAQEGCLLCRVFVVRDQGAHLFCLFEENITVDIDLLNLVPVIL